MIDTKPTDFGPFVEYGLGVMRLLGQCEAEEVIGHSGTVFGYQTQLFTTLDGVRTMATAIPIYVGSDAIHNAVGRVWNRELCAQPSAPAASARSTADQAKAPVVSPAVSFD